MEYRGSWKDYISDMKARWVGKRVRYCGAEHTVVDVDYNGGLLIDKPARFTDTTAVSESMVEVIA